ncbi:MAG: hypothetical protein DWQ36_09910 [Acidobacteria bacterium]|nr:MAG: hypothetical protein DWQ30_01190 [Acidobacteriota bacterium]REK08372.1 MAG: hypothetical protein DWQ36_09910 [Acidobacteriota bacterium]
MAAAVASSQRLPPIDHIERTRRLYSSLGYEPYRWVHSASPPELRPLSKPLAASRVALIASGGIYRHGQRAFHHRDDLSLRIIERDTPDAELRATHFAYDLSAARRDPGAVFPLAALRRAEAAGRIGELAPRAYTFMGGIYSARKVREVVAPELARRLGEDEVDVGLLVPV